MAAREVPEGAAVAGAKEVPAESDLPAGAVETPGPMDEMDLMVRREEAEASR